ncbi:MAG: hypothetical protein ABEL76_02390 [Bradymonadaceae bacterium]
MCAAESQIQQLEAAAAVLEPLPYDFVFIGGATIGLYVDDPAASGLRATEDVDCVVSVTTHVDYTDLETELRRNGFGQSTVEDASLCRWTKNDVVLDVLPTAPDVIGFEPSDWLEKGIAEAKRRELPSGREIRVFDTPHLLAAKIEVFEDRGDGGLMRSVDVEDIVTILDGRQNVFEELAGDSSASEFVRDWLAEFDRGDLTRLFRGHLSRANRGRVSLLVDRVEQLCTD